MADEIAHVLIIDDDVDAAFLVRRVLAKSGIPHEAQHIVDGEEAMRYLADCFGETGGSQNKPPHLILLDIKMPKVNGFDVLEWLRARPGRTVPVVVLTTSDDPRDQERAQELAADAYVAKFPAPEEFRQLLTKLLEGRVNAG
jgi:CheY-like chemotaxis protein